MQAIILAGGKGTRLRPYTAVFPKPLVPIGEKPILEIVINQLRAAGFYDIVISTGHLAHLIETYFGDGSKYGVSIRYVREDKPLNTAGALKLIDRLDENFLVMNGDLMTDLDYRDIFEYHINGNHMATIGVIARVDKLDYGLVSFDEDGVFMDYVEKPSNKYYISMGVNVLNRKAIGYIEKNESIGMPDLMKRLAVKENVRCYLAICRWLDIGRPDDYERAQEGAF